MTRQKTTVGVLMITLLLLSLALTGCSSGNTAGATTARQISIADSSNSPGAAATGGVVTTQNVITEKHKDEDSDSSWDASASTIITLADTTATVSGSGAAVSGGTVTITAAGTYVVSGTLTKGQILVNATKKDLVRLVLNGVDITAETNAAIYAGEADKLVIILADGTTNTIADVESYTYADTEKEEPNAAIFSKCDLSINGTGSLTVNGKFSHGIATKDDLVVAGGNVTVNSVNAAIRGKDSVTILDGTLNLTSYTGDGLKSTNDTDTDKGWILIKGGTFNIAAYNDGIQAYTTLQIDGGTFNITTGGGWPGGSLKRGSHAVSSDGVVSGTNPTDGSYKGLKGNDSIVMNGGTFTISAYDDSIHSNGDITINGGIFSMQAGDDGIHADGTVTINGGDIGIQNSYEGIEGAYINLNSGKISVYATDDGINVCSSSGLLTIAGGDIYVNASGDGIDSNGGVNMTGGTVYVDGPTTGGDGAIDYERQFTISGGTLVAAGNSGQAQAPGTASEQPSILLYYTSTQSAGTEITLKSSDGTTLVSYTPQKYYQSVVISTPEMKTGSTYTLYSNGTKLCDVTLSSSVTSISDTGAAVSFGQSFGQGGGMGGGRGPGGQGRDGQRPGGGQ